MSHNIKQEFCPPSLIAAADSSTSPEPPRKKQRLDTDMRISDVLVPVNPIAALRNLIELPKLNFEIQDEPTKLFTVSATFGGNHFRATDPTDFDGAKLKLASQILHSYILTHAFSSDLLVNVPVSHHARIIEGKNDFLYIVGQERNARRSVNEMYYSLYELKPGTKILLTSEPNTFKDRNGIPNYLATVMINGRSFHGYGNREELAKKEAIRSAFSSFTPEDMGYLPVFRRPIPSVEDDSVINLLAEIEHLSNNIASRSLSKPSIRKIIQYFMRDGPTTLALMEPPAQCVIIKKDAAGFTARVSRGGVNYDCTGRSEKLAKKSATYMALRSLSAEEVLKLARVVQENGVKKRAQLAIGRAEMDQIEGGRYSDSEDEPDHHDAAGNSTAENFEIKMKTKLRFCKPVAIKALGLLRPPTESVIIRQDVLTTNGKTVYTARVIHGGVHYQSTKCDEKRARKYAAFKALSDLDADEADRLAKLLPPGSVMGGKGKKATKKKSNTITERAIIKAENAVRKRGELTNNLDDDINQKMGQPWAERPTSDGLNAGQVSAATVDYTAENVESVSHQRLHHLQAVDNIKMKTKLRFVKKRAIAALSLLNPPPYFVVRKTCVTKLGAFVYTATVTRNGVSYEGIGTRKNARKEAALKALSDLDADEADELAKILPPGFLMFGGKVADAHQDSATTEEKKNTSITNMPHRYTDYLESSSMKSEENDPEVANQPSCSNNNNEEGEDHSFGDYISKLVEEAFQQSIKNDRSKSTYKVLAGIVMSSGIAINGSQVICFATGDDCINGRHLSLKGEAVNDCHAVVLARRGLVSFLYDQLENYRTQPEESVFEPAGNDDGLPLRLKIKEGILFHLYVSSPPCGDACLSSDSSTSINGRLLGGLQTKVEGVDGGTAPVSPGMTQTMHDFAMGQLLLTMSCSDKMARWNVVGAQGSLLSHLINPVYFHSVVIANLLHPESVHRAIIGRIENLKDIPAPFMVMKPIIATTSVRKSIPSLTPKISVCWVKGWIHHEVIACIKGKTLNMDAKTGLSELCKFRFFKRFVSLASSNPKWRPLIQTNRESGSIIYGKMKAAAEGFRKTNDLLKESFTAAGLGRWIKKPSEQDLFQIDF